MKAWLLATAISLNVLSSGAIAADKETVTVNKNAAIAGGTAAGATVVGIGAVAGTASAATITSTLAMIGCGSMAIGIGVVAAVPVVIGGAAYGIYSLIADDDKKKP